MKSIILRQEAGRLIQKAENIEKNIENVSMPETKEIEETSERLSGRRSDVLAGIAGGVIGASGGIALAAFGLGTTIIISGPLGMLLGGTLAILAWRGREYFRLEREVQIKRIKRQDISAAREEMKKSIESLLEMIHNLPKNTPENVRNEAWKNYSELQRKYTEISISNSPEIQSKESADSNIINGDLIDDHTSIKDSD